MQFPQAFHYHGAVLFVGDYPLARNVLTAKGM